MTDRTVVYRLKSDVTGMLAGTKAASASLRKLGDDATALNKEGRAFRQGFDTLGSAAGKASLVATAALGAIITKTANFDEAMSHVAATGDEARSNFEALRKAAVDAGASTAFSATESAEAIENLLKAGVSARDVLGGGLTAALDLAAAGSLNVADAAEIMATSMGQFQLSGADATRVADALAAGAGKAMGEVTDMANAFKYVGPVANQMGISIEETAGSVALLAQQGILGDQAGTSLRGMLTSLTSPSKKAADEMANLGINLYDAQGQFIGFSGVAEELKDGLGGLTNAERDQALGRIFGNEQVTAARVLYAAGAEDVDKWTAAVSEQGYAADVAATKLDNLKGDLEQLGGALETAAIGMGEDSNGPLRTTIQTLTDVVNGFNALPGPMKTATTAGLAFTAVFGAGTFLTGKTLNGLATTREAMEQLGVSAEGAAKSTKVLGRAMGAGAGIAVFAAGLSTTDKLVGTLETTMGAAAAGFSVGGPWGAAVGGAIGLVVGLGKSHDDTAVRVKALTDTFDTQTGAITNNTRAKVAARAQDDGLLAAAEELGLASSVVTDAILGSTSAQYELNQAVSGYGVSYAITSAEDMAKTYTDQEIATEMATRSATKLRSEVPGLASDFSAAAEDAKQLAAGIASSTTSGSAMTSMTGGLGAAMSDAADDAAEFSETVKALNEILSGRADMRSYQAAIDDFTASLKENGNTFDINTEKGRANEANLDNIASSALAVADNLEYADRKKFLTNAIKDLRTMGDNLGLPKAEVRRLINLLNEANDANVKPQIDIDSKAAQDRLRIIKQQLDSIDRFIPVNIHVSRTGSGGDVPFVSGGTSTRREATGGYISGPGTGTSDSILSYLSNGEYVIKAAAVQKYGTHMFDSLNAMHFADGGKVTKKKPPKYGVAQYAADNTSALQAAIDQLSMVMQDQTSALEAATSTQEFWAGKMSDLAQATVAGFNTGLFDKDSDVWAAGSGGGALFNLNRDIAGLQERQGLQSQLANMGLSGDTLAALLSQGSNTDISQLIASGQVGQYASLYAQRAALQSSAGGSAAQAAFGQQYAQASADAAKQAALVQQTNVHLVDMNTRLTRMEAQLQRANDNGPERTGDAVGRVINGTAAAGHRARMNQGVSRG